MTSRRGTLIEEGAREQLQIAGYSVQILPHTYDNRLPPAHLVASRPGGETLFIRIRKIAHWGSSVDILEMHFPRDIVQLRKFLARNRDVTGIRCEIWFYSLTYGFVRFEILADAIREVPADGS